MSSHDVSVTSESLPGVLLYAGIKLLLVKAVEKNNPGNKPKKNPSIFNYPRLLMVGPVSLTQLTQAGIMPFIKRAPKTMTSSLDSLLMPVLSLVFMER